jgi:hypothetical protein
MESSESFRREIERVEIGRLKEKEIRDWEIKRIGKWYFNPLNKLGITALSRKLLIVLNR